ncbi:MAG TPA: hypothetical protein VFI00_00945 [Kribbella sp.]|nr:hypothetical protein [Kribbella sp.]
MTQRIRDAIELLPQAGVRWLYADRLPVLGQYVTLRHAAADATIYELR